VATVVFSREVLADCLWAHGEDALANQALSVSDSELTRIQSLAATFHDPSFPLPVQGVKVKNSHVVALAAVTHFEGSLRPLARDRRRGGKVQQ